MRKSTLLFGLLCSALFFCTGVINAAGNYIPVRLPKGVSVELPKNWKIQSDNNRILVNSWLEAKGWIDGTSAKAFTAHYFDDTDRMRAIFNIHYYPDLEVTQAEARAFSKADVKELNRLLRLDLEASCDTTGMKIIDWVGTTKKNINGATVFVTEYRRSPSMKGSNNFCVRLVRILNEKKSFTIVISYDEQMAFLLRPICDKIINSIRI